MWGRAGSHNQDNQSWRQGNGNNGGPQCASCDFGERLRNLPYLHMNPQAQKFTGMKLWLFANELHTRQVLNTFCEPCVEYQRTYNSNELVDSEFHCGDTKVLVSHTPISHLSTDQLEEAEIRITGQTSWYVYFFL